MMHSLYQNAMSAAITVLNYQKNQLEKARDREVKALEKQRDAAKKPLEAQVKAIEKQKEALEKANEQRERNLALNKALYEQARAMAQRTKLVYKNGQMVYQTDTEAVRNAKEGLDDAVYNKKVGELQDQIDALNKKIEEIDEYYDDLIKKTEEFYDAQIEAIQDIIDQWEELQAQLELAEALDSLKEFGLTMEDILSGKGIDVIKNGLLATAEQSAESLAKAFGDSTQNVNDLKKALLGYDQEAGLAKTLDDVGEAAKKTASTIGGGGSGASTEADAADGGNTPSIKDAIDDVNKADLTPVKDQFAGEDDSVLSSVKKVVSAINGGGDTSGDKKEQAAEKKEGSENADPSTLLGAIQDLPVSSEESMKNLRDSFNGETNSLKSSINECVQELQSLLEKFDELIALDGREITLRIASAGSKLAFTGTAFASGNWSAKSKGKSGNDVLVGELGQELVVDPRTGTWHTVGDHGAEFTNIPSNSIVFNHRQTEEIFKNGKINSRGKAYAGGKLPEGFSPLSDNDNKFTILTGMVGKIDIANQKLASLDKNVATLVNNKTINNSNQVFNIENTFACNGVTVDQVQKQIEGNFVGMMNRALQQAMTR